MRLTGVGPQTAANQAAALFALAGLLALVGISGTPGQTGRLLTVGFLDLMVAGAAWALPWRRWHAYAPLGLAVPAFVILGISTWAFGGFAAGTGPFFVLVFAWLGLQFPPWACLAAAPGALVAYVAPLLATGQPPAVISSAMILLPTVVGIGLLIAHQVEHQRRDRERIGQVERWRAALTATLAHDLRSPLTTVQLVLETVLDDPGDLPAAHRAALVGSALRQLGRVTRLSAGLLDLERVDSRGELRLDLADVPVARAVSEALEQINAQGVRVEVDSTLVVTADPERLEQMLINLTANALRHGRPPVVIDAAPVEEGVRIAVRDHGPGVRPEARDTLFSPFAGSAGVAGSTGLGLWIVDRLARAHGGAVGYEPADPGARLVLTLPRGPDGPAPPGTRESHARDGDARDNEVGGGRERWSMDAKPAAGKRRRSGTAAS